MKLKDWVFGLIAIIIFLATAFPLQAEEPLPSSFKTISALIGLVSGFVQLLNWKSSLGRGHFDGYETSAQRTPRRDDKAKT
jgi:hypothetical protein